MTNPFLQVHTARDGKSIPIISMQADHLVNLVNLVLLKLVRKAMNMASTEMYAEFAPAGTPEKARRFLGLPELTLDMVASVENKLADLQTQLLGRAFQECIPYIVVGLVRDDTRAGVLRIVQEATGITGQIILETHAPLSDVMLLADGLEDDLGDIWRPGHPSNYGDN